MPIREALTSGLRAAMKRRDAAAVSAFRSALSAISNAEAAPVAASASGALATGPHFAGTTAGVGATEAARISLSEEQMRAIVDSERSSLLEHAQHLEDIGRLDQAAASRAASGALADALGGAAGSQRQ